MPVAPALPNRTFGIELEIIGSLQGAFRAIEDAGIRVALEGYNHHTRSYWKVVTDASVRGGCEVVSPVLQGEAGLAEARQVCDALTAAGIRVDRQCGFHVHVGASDLNAGQIKNLLKRYAAHEASIDAWMPPSRRSNANGYCRSVAPHAAAVERVQDDRPAAALQHLISDRYVKLNIQSMWRQGTVEFRHHSGTIDADKVENWTRFALAFVEASLTQPGAGEAFTPRADYERQRNRNYGNIIEQIEAAGGSMTLARAGGRTYQISGPGGAFAVTTAELNRLYVSPTDTALLPIAFQAWWAQHVAPILPQAAAVDSPFRGVPEAVKAFYERRAARLASA